MIQILEGRSLNHKPRQNKLSQDRVHLSNNKIPQYFSQTFFFALPSTLSKLGQKLLAFICKSVTPTNFKSTNYYESSTTETSINDRVLCWENPWIKGEIQSLLWQPQKTSNVHHSFTIDTTCKKGEKWSTCILPKLPEENSNHRGHTRGAKWGEKSIRKLSQEK